MTMKVPTGAMAILLAAALSAWGHGDKASNQAHAEKGSESSRPQRNSACSITVDGRSGETSGPLVYWSGEAVTVCLENKNPFRFAYKTTINNQPFDDDAAIIGFVTGALGINLPSKAEERLEIEPIEPPTLPECAEGSAGVFLRVQEAAAAVNQLKAHLSELMVENADGGALQTSAGRALVQY